MNVSEKCCICMLKFSICYLDCKHYFCEDCIQKWSKKSKKCPLCREKTKGVWMNSGKGKYVAPIDTISTKSNLDKKRNWISDFLYTEKDDYNDEDYVEDYGDESGAHKRISKINKGCDYIDAESESDSSETLWEQFEQMRNTQNPLLEEDICPHPHDMLISTEDRSELSVRCTICGKTWQNENSLSSYFSPSKSELSRMKEYK